MRVSLVTLCWCSSSLGAAGAALRPQPSLTVGVEASKSSTDDSDHGSSSSKGGDLAAAGVVHPAFTPAEHVWGCLPGNVSAHMDFCDHRLPLDQRVGSLLGSLNLDEKVKLLNSGPSGCGLVDAGVTRLGIPAYKWGREANSGPGGSCVAGHCPVQYPSNLGITASFNRSLYRQKGGIIATEMRALDNLRVKDAGANGWGPNINIVRDPRFGRNSELCSEDPLLSGVYATEVVRGMQEGVDSRYMKIHASLKHYTAYSIEGNKTGGRSRGSPNVSDARNVIDVQISEFDLHDTYLAQYAIAFQRGKPAGAMCSYTSVNGVPMCASPSLLNVQIRKTWAQPDCLIVTDCGCIDSMVVGNRDGSNNYAATHLDATAVSINAGTDLELGQSWGGYNGNATSPHAWTGEGGLIDAVSRGKVTNATIDAALGRGLKARMRLGLFDPIEAQQYLRFGVEKLGSDEHVTAVADAATQSFVLLANRRNTLPLIAGKSLAVVGAHATTQLGLLPNYAAQQWCAAGGTACIPRIGDSLATANTGGRTSVVEGVPVSVNCTSASTAGCNITGVVAAVNDADVVVLCLGFTTKGDEGPPVAYEGTDRPDFALPGSQAALADAVFAAAGATTPVVLLLINGGAFAIDAWVHRAAAVVEVFFPALQSPMIASALFGRTNRWGKLPMTYYASPLPWAMDDMAISTGVGSECATHCHPACPLPKPTRGHAVYAWCRNVSLHHSRVPVQLRRWSLAHDVHARMHLPQAVHRRRLRHQLQLHCQEHWHAGR
eukprot:COSAG06_NODE_831_length_12041_cov_5.766789_2_plen_773_part_00